MVVIPSPNQSQSQNQTPNQRRRAAPDGQPWRDIPLSEFPESWRQNLSREMNGGPPELDWVCGPCVSTDVSSDVERGNFTVLWNELCALRGLSPEYQAPDDWAVILASHWTAGCMEFIFVRPGSAAHKLCCDIRGRLASFPDLMRANLAGSGFGSAPDKGVAP